MQFNYLDIYGNKLKKLLILNFSYCQSVILLRLQVLIPLMVKRSYELLKMDWIDKIMNNFQSSYIKEFQTSQHSMIPRSINTINQMVCILKSHSNYFLFFEPKIDDQDFEIIDSKVFHQVNSLKQDINNKYIVIANNNGFRIYGTEQAKIIEIVEDFDQPIYDIDFINETFLFVLGFEKSIAIWDNLNKRIVQQYPILGQQITQIDYRNPFIICAFDNHILVINQKTNQAYRYIKYIGNLQKYITYIINRDIYQICLVYLGYESQQIVVDNITLQNIITINTKELSKKDYNYDKEISIAYLKKFKQRMINNSSEINQWNSYCYVGLSDDGNKIAISEFGNSQYIYILQLDWKENTVQILNTLYRGHSKKELRLFLGQDDLVICLSFEKYKKQNGYDITLHLYYKNDQQNSQSKKRYYLRSWSQHQMELRQKDIIINFLQNEVRMFSRFNYIINIKYDPKSLTIEETIKDEQKVYWIQA